MGGTVPLVHSDPALLSEGLRAAAVASYSLPSAQGVDVSQWKPCDGCDGMNCGLPFVPPNHPRKARSPLSWLPGEIVHFRLLGGTGLFSSTGFLFGWRLPRPAWSRRSSLGCAVCGMSLLWSQQTMGCAGLCHHGRGAAGAADTPQCSGGSSPAT